MRAGRVRQDRTAELRFTADEAAALLSAVTGAGLPSGSVAALTARTEGWAAGLQLAGLSLRGQPDAAGFVAAFSGSHRYVLDYLAEEVLDGQPERVREFLLETSVLDRLSGELCDVVTGRSGSQALLQQIEAAGLFLTPLDEVRGWWRYHHLFADLLRARLQQEQPGKVAASHRNAAAWCAEHGLADDAVRHALSAGDPIGSARLIEQHFDEIFLQGESATIQRWLAALPAELARSRRRLALAQGWMALVGGDLEAAGAALDAADRAFADAADEPFEPSVGRPASLLANVPVAIALGRTYLAVLYGDAEAAAASASQALAALGEREWVLHSVGLWMLALAERLRGRLEDAERGFAASVAGWRAAGEHPLAAWACHDLGRVQRAQGRLDATLATYRQVLDLNRFFGMLLAGEIVNQTSLAQMQRTVPVISFEGKTIDYGLGLHRMEVPGRGTFWGHDGSVWGAGAISMTRAGGKRQMSIAVNLQRWNKLDSSGKPQHHPIDDALSALCQLTWGGSAGL